MAANPHKSFSKLNLRRARAEATVLAKANQHYAAAVRLEKQGKPLQARAEAAKGRALVKRVQGSRSLDGPVGKLSNPTITGIQGEILEADKVIADLESDPFYRETPGRRAFRAKWLAYHRRQRRQLEGILRQLQKPRRRNNGIVEAAAGLQVLEYIGSKAKRVGLGKKPKFNPRHKGWRDALGVWHAEAAENPFTPLTKMQRRAVVKALRHHTSEHLRDVVRFNEHPDIKAVAQEILSKRTRRSKSGLDHSTGKAKNPSVTEVSRMFQGEANGAIKTADAPNSAPSDLARIGRFVFLKLDNGHTLRIPRAAVAADTKGRLWIVGKGPLLSRKAVKGERLDYGEIATICYDTTKVHLEDGKRHEWVHEFGEDGGKRPRLQVDDEGMPLIVGGSYKIRQEGIVN